MTQIEFINSALDWLMDRDTELECDDNEIESRMFALLADNHGFTVVDAHNPEPVDERQLRFEI
jgi:hypothetical protein